MPTPTTKPGPSWRSPWDPARPGSNQIHLYLFDARSGAQFTRVRQLTVSATQSEESIGPLSLEPQRSGPGHYTVQGVPLSVAGDWGLDVTIRVSAFDQYETVIQVPVRWAGRVLRKVLLGARIGCCRYVWLDSTTRHQRRATRAGGGGGSAREVDYAPTMRKDMCLWVG